MELYNILNNTEHTIRITDKNTKLLTLDFALFSSKGTPVIEILWCEALESSKSDMDLFEFTLLTNNKNSATWLNEKIGELMSSGVPYEKAKAITLCGLTNDETCLAAYSKQLEELKENNDTWHSRLAKIALERQERNEFAQHWFNEFWTAETDIDAWASFNLFLKCADRRFWSWSKQYIPHRSPTAPLSTREAFYIANRCTIRNKIKENEKSMGDHFLGQKIINYQLWPWM